MPTDRTEQAPLREQEVCLDCGFCCDGTLFVHAILNPGEKGNLPEKIEEKVFSEGERDYFRLPCKYFSGRCTIYDRKRADVCGAYRCQLLRDFSAEKISIEQVLEMVKRAGETRRELLEEYRRVSGSEQNIHFMEVLKELGKHLRQEREEASPGMDYELLLARCNIFEALLIKHFRSADDFEKLVMK
ncbi:MAG: hypothetical protein IH592_08905 [Bacteroidales bacterium]|nr:hypothetical protein [Bacteroidales bacterium]